MEMQITELTAEKAKNRKLFMLVLSNIRFLARQGLALKGDGDEGYSNFIQLLRLHCQESTNVDMDKWLARRLNKCMSPEIQNECLQLLAFHILCNVSSPIARSSCYRIMADECTDCPNQEQFTINYAPCSTMKQCRLNHTMVLNISKEQLDDLNMVAVAKEFVSKNEHRNHTILREVSVTALKV